jgi:hypothetical protein
VTSLQGKRTVVAALVTACSVVVTAGAFMSYQLNKNPPLAIAAQVKQVEPAVVAGSSVPAPPTGCWDVSISNDTELAATWARDCADAPPVSTGEQPWPRGVVRLRALGAGEPPMAWAQPRAVLSQELAQHGTGALVYLPANSDGSGYYVAAWSLAGSTDDEESAVAVKRGITVGVYGAPPTSVATPSGRVYLNTDLSPRSWSSTHHEDATSGDDDGDGEALTDADTAATSESEN